MNFKTLTLGLALFISGALNAMEAQSLNKQSQALKTAFISISLFASNPKESATKELVISYLQAGKIVSPSPDELTQTLSVGAYNARVVFEPETNVKHLYSTRYADTLKIAAQILVNKHVMESITGGLILDGEPEEWTCTNYLTQGNPEFAKLVIDARSHKSDNK